MEHTTGHTWEPLHKTILLWSCLPTESPEPAQSNSRTFPTGLKGQMLRPQKAAKGGPERDTVLPATLSCACVKRKEVRPETKASVFLDTRVLWRQGGFWRRCLAPPITVGSAPGPLKPKPPVFLSKVITAALESWSTKHHVSSTVILAQKHHRSIPTPALSLADVWEPSPPQGKQSPEVVEQAEQPWLCQLPVQVPTPVLTRSGMSHLSEKN